MEKASKQSLLVLGSSGKERHAYTQRRSSFGGAWSLVISANPVRLTPRTWAERVTSRQPGNTGNNCGSRGTEPGRWKTRERAEEEEEKEEEEEE